MTNMRYAATGSKVEDDRIARRSGNSFRLEHKARPLAYLNSEGGLYIYSVNGRRPEFSKKKKILTARAPDAITRRARAEEIIIGE